MRIKLTVLEQNGVGPWPSGGLRMAGGGRLEFPKIFRRASQHLPNISMSTWPSWLRIGLFLPVLGINVFVLKRVLVQFAPFPGLFLTAALIATLHLLRLR